MPCPLIFFNTRPHILDQIFLDNFQNDEDFMACKEVNSTWAKLVTQLLEKKRILDEKRFLYHWFEKDLEPQEILVRDEVKSLTLVADSKWLFLRLKLYAAFSVYDIGSNLEYIVTRRPRQNRFLACLIEIHGSQS